MLPGALHCSELGPRDRAGDDPPPSRAAHSRHASRNSCAISVVFAKSARRSSPSRTAGGCSRPNPALARPIDGVVPSGPPVTVDPRNGRLTATGSPAYSEATVCEGDRQALAQLDEPPRFRQMLDEANRANVSFYPVDPRGLVTFDEDIVPAAGVGTMSNNPTHPNRSGSATPERAPRQPPADGRCHRRPGHHRELESGRRTSPGVRRFEHLLPARLLLDRQARWQVPLDQGSREAARRPASRAARVSCGHAPAMQWIPLRTTLPPVSVASTAFASVLETLGTTSGEPTLRVRAAAAYTPDGAIALSVCADGARGSGGGNEWAGGGDADVMVIDSSGISVASWSRADRTGLDECPPGRDVDMRSSPENTRCGCARRAAAAWRPRQSRRS